MQGGTAVLELLGGSERGRERNKHLQSSRGRGRAGQQRERGGEPLGGARGGPQRDRPGSLRQGVDRLVVAECGTARQVVRPFRGPGAVGSQRAGGVCVDAPSPRRRSGIVGGAPHDRVSEPESTAPTVAADQSGAGGRVERPLDLQLGAIRDTNKTRWVKRVSHDGRGLEHRPRGLREAVQLGRDCLDHRRGHITVERRGRGRTARARARSVRARERRRVERVAAAVAIEPFPRPLVQAPTSQLRDRMPRQRAQPQPLHSTVPLRRRQRRRQ